MENPFDEICQRLLRIENLLFRLQPPKQIDQKSDPDYFLSVKEAADFLKEAKATLYGRTSRREIPFYKRNKRLYFKKSDLIAWLENGRRKTDKEILSGLDY
jgi:excisionase family DNA binding protein